MAAYHFSDLSFLNKKPTTPVIPGRPVDNPAEILSN